MRIDFSAYADDYTAEGTLELADDRLSDLLENADELEIENVVIRALDDGRMHALPSAVVPRHDLCLVMATGPRGRRDRRIRTRAYPMRAESGPYVVIGYFQGPITADPLIIAMRREVIALSPATVTCTIAGEATQIAHDAVLLIRAKLSLFEAASDADVGLAKALLVETSVDSHAKDFTGDVYRPELEDR